jgi:cytochrome c-type biogenesis protein CcmE
MKNLSPRIAAAATAATLALGAVTEAGAVFTVPAEITDAATNVGLVGAAVFTVMVGIKLYKWLRRAL